MCIYRGLEGEGEAEEEYMCAEENQQAFTDQEFKFVIVYDTG
jgi:hypothetical protein